ncbi:MAG TPA: hypothetical protein VEU73_08740 [Gemmatimonadales bacterium]|nr:hypothetical protein [Gemmatimonadales bacterium]
MPTKTLMHLRACSIVLGWLAWAAPSAAAQNRAAGDSDLTRTTGHWTASGVTFQSGAAAHRFAVELKRVGDQLRATLPAELKLAEAREQGARIFAVRPNWSMPAPEWVAADPDFWRVAPAPRRSGSQ